MEVCPIDLSTMTGVAFRVAHQFRQTHRDATVDSDMFGEAMYALCKAQKAYNPASGYKFTTFATTVIRHHLLTVLKKVTRREKICRGHIFSDRADPYTEFIQPPPSVSPEQVERMELVMAAISNLSPRQQEIVGMVLDGKTFEEIGELKGYSRSNANRIFQQSIRALRAELCE